jgi:hypothetical protein
VVLDSRLNANLGDVFRIGESDVGLSVGVAGRFLRAAR